MDFNEYQGLSKRTINQGLDQKDMLANFSLGLTGEAGELVDHIKKALFHGAELDQEYITKELGDVLWYLSALATVVGVDLNYVAAHNVKKLKTRYPQGFTEQASKERVDESMR